MFTITNSKEYMETCSTTSENEKIFRGYFLIEDKENNENENTSFSVHKTIVNDNGKSERTQMFCFSHTRNDDEKTYMFSLTVTVNIDRDRFTLYLSKGIINEDSENRTMTKIVDDDELCVKDIKKMISDYNTESWDW